MKRTQWNDLHLQHNAFLAADRFTKIVVIASFYTLEVATFV